MLSNDHNQGFLSKFELKLPFAKVASAIYEPSCSTLLLFSKSEDKCFFEYTNNSWHFRNIKVRKNYHVLRLLESFVIARF